MALLVDTSVFVALERAGHSQEWFSAVAADEEVAIAAVTASELLHGVHRADTAIRRGRREVFVEGILERFPVIPFDLAVARAYARLGEDLRAKGATIGTHDLMIAATALARGDRIWTFNVRHFGLVDGLPLVQQ